MIAIAVALRDSSWRVLPSFKPDDPRDALSTAWQVEATLVGLGFALLLLLIEFSRSDASETRRPVSEVLTRETGVLFALELAAASVAAVGALALWIASPVSVVLAGFLITVTLISLVWCFLQALSILFDHGRLRRLSERLLKARAQDWVDDLWVVGRANEIIDDALASEGVVGAFIHPAPDPQRWIVIPAPTSGRIVDVDHRRLAESLAALPTSVVAGPVESGSGPVAGQQPVAGHPWGYRLRGCDDLVSQADPLILLDRNHFALPLVNELPFGRYYEIRTEL